VWIESGMSRNAEYVQEKQRAGENNDEVIDWLIDWLIDGTVDSVSTVTQTQIASVFREKCAADRSCSVSLLHVLHSSHSGAMVTVLVVSAVVQLLTGSVRICSVRRRLTPSVAVAGRRWCCVVRRSIPSTIQRTFPRCCRAAPRHQRRWRVADELTRWWAALRRTQL